MAVPDAQLARIVERLRASGLRELAGTRVTATIPVGDRLLNDVIAASLPSTGAIREFTVHPQAQNRLGVRVKLARPEFLPAITATLAIERQPELPDAPLLAFRVTGLPGLIALAAPVLSLRSMMPPGIRLEGDRLTVDLASLLEQQGHGELLRHVERLRVTSEPGRLVIEVDAGVR